MKKNQILKQYILIQKILRQKEDEGKMNMLRMCSNNECQLEATKEEWVENGDTCPNCGRRSYQLVEANGENDWENAIDPMDSYPTGYREEETIENKPIRSAMNPIVKVGLVLLLALCVILIAQLQLPKTEIPITPTVTAQTVIETLVPEVIVTPDDIVDIKSVSALGSVQYAMMALLFVIGLCGYLDRRQSNQAYDAWIAIIAALLVVWIGSLPVFRKFFEAIELGNPSLIIVLVSLAVVITTSLTGTVDLSPIGIFFGIVAIFGGTVLNHLGSFQDVFRIPDSSLYTMSTTLAFLAGKQWEVAKFSVVVYSCLLLAVFAYGYEILRPKSDIRPDFGGIVISIIGVGIYVVLRTLAKDIPVISTIIGAMMVVFLYNFIVATIMRERLSGSGVNWAEYRLGLLKVVSPWDIFAFQAIIGALLIVATGKI